VPTPLLADNAGPPQLRYSQSARTETDLRNRLIVSLLDMVGIQAEHFLRLMQRLDQTEGLFQSLAKENPNSRVDEKTKGILQRDMAIVEETANDLGLVVPKIWARDFIDRLDKPDWRAVDCSEVQQRVEKIRSAIEAELRGKLFMYIEANKLPYYSQRALFGEQVENKLPAVSSDIAEAGRCFALGRHVATVFHLMRVMETGVREFGNSLGAVINPRDVWDTILQRANALINSLPTAAPVETERRAAYEQLYTSLNAVRVAWRNPTMHGVERSYTEEEAKEVWDCSRAFMRRLAGVLP
jgi:hypothetical protein